jgi:hypothetical protein
METNRFIDQVDTITQRKNYNFYTTKTTNLRRELTDDIANALPTVLASRPVSQAVWSQLSYLTSSHWERHGGDYYCLDDKVEDIMRHKIKLQLCCTCFLARKRLAELKRIERIKRDLAIAMTLHTHLGEKSVMGTLTEDLLLACLI